MNPDAHAKIKAELIALLADIKSADSRSLIQHLEALERLTAENRSALSPQLLHFLEKRSYAKAAAYLEAGSPALFPHSSAP